MSEFGDCLRTGADVKFFVDVTNVGVHGWDTDVQRVGNLLV